MLSLGLGVSGVKLKSDLYLEYCAVSKLGDVLFRPVDAGGEGRGEGLGAN